MKPPPSRAEDAARPPELRRILGVWDATALIVGIIIGSGIFATPPLVAAHLPGLAPILGVWLLGGLLAFCGALCYAELAGMFPVTGGAYVFLREGYGRLPAFCYGWSALLITYPASIAGVALVFAAYLSRILPVTQTRESWVAAFVCLVLAALNILGVRLGALVLRLFTLAKVLALSAVFLVPLFAARGSIQNLEPVWARPEAGWSAAPVALALVAVLWTYEGWADGPTLAGEMRDGGRGLVRALFLGTLGVTVVYVLVNLAYLLVLGIDGVRASDSVAVDMAERLFGVRGTAFVTLLVLTSTLGAMMGMIIGASRVFFALGRDGLFLEWVGRVHPGLGSPAWALAGVGIISAAYALVGTFETIIRYFVGIAGIWFLFNISSVILHRIRRPDAHRPFRVPLYPLPPLLFLVVTLGILVQLFRNNTRDTVAGIVILLAAVPVYGVWVKLRRDRLR